MKLPKSYPKILGWGPSRLSLYEECPLHYQLRYGMKLCPCCFKEQALSTYDESVQVKDGTIVPPNSGYCQSRKRVLKQAAPLERGSIIGRSLELYVNGTSDELDSRITNSTVLKIAKKLRAQFAKQQVSTELSIVINSSWEVVGQYTKYENGAWLRAKLDVLRFAKKGLVEVIDWKTGGIKNGQIRAQSKYDDQLSIYNTAALTAAPDAGRAEASLVFVDAPDGVDPVVASADLDATRAELPALQKKWSLRVVAMLNDETFAPRPGFYCGWCEFSKEKGGPCKVG